MIPIKIRMQKVTTVIFLSIAILFSLCAFSYAASYYVDKAANGANNGTSWSNAWESFADIYWGGVKSGDTIYISGGTSGMEVSWQVTGIRRDAFANAHRIPVEEEKNIVEQGTYMHPVEVGMPESMGKDAVIRNLNSSVQ